MIVLPAEGRLQSFENNLDLAAYTTLRQGFTSYQVNLTMPQFSFEWATSLKPVLQSPGMTDAFEVTQADFTGIASTDEVIYIYDVLHKSFIAVDEKGTEASAATVVIATASPGLTPAPLYATITVNRPFLFFIYGPAGSLIFFGRVMNP